MLCQVIRFGGSEWVNVFSGWGAVSRPCLLSLCSPAWAVVLRTSLHAALWLGSLRSLSRSYIPVHDDGGRTVRRRRGTKPFSLHWTLHKRRKDEPVVVADDLAVLQASGHTFDPKDCLLAVTRFKCHDVWMCAGGGVPSEASHCYCRLHGYSPVNRAVARKLKCTAQITWTYYYSITSIEVCQVMGRCGVKWWAVVCTTMYRCVCL